MHALIVVPFYFFTALSLSALLILLARLFRLPVTISTLVVSAVLLSLLTMIFVLGSDAYSLDDLTGLRMLAIGITSFLVAGLDALLMRSIPHPLDRELDIET